MCVRIREGFIKTISPRIARALMFSIFRANPRAHRTREGTEKIGSSTPSIRRLCMSLVYCQDFPGRFDQEHRRAIEPPSAPYHAGPFFVRFTFSPEPGTIGREGYRNEAVYAQRGGEEVRGPIFRLSTY